MAEYIDREDLLKRLPDDLPYKASVKRVLMQAPTADVEEVRHGEWLEQRLLGQTIYDCSECATLGSPMWKRCPVCEAKMRGTRKPKDKYTEEKK